jgi:hypothetical protein
MVAVSENERMRRSRPLSSLWAILMSEYVGAWVMVAITVSVGLGKDMVIGLVEDMLITKFY